MYDVTRFSINSIFRSTLLICYKAINYIVHILHILTPNSVRNLPLYQQYKKILPIRVVTLIRLWLLWAYSKLKVALIVLGLLPGLALLILPTIIQTTPIIGPPPPSTSVIRGPVRVLPLEILTITFPANFYC